jgi:hypothetical protein
MTEAPDDADTTPRCPSCGHATDDISKLTDKQVMERMRSEMYREMLRTLEQGNANHQELAIIRGILRDNKMFVENDEPPEDDGARRAEDATYEFSPNTLKETSGG